MHKITKNDLEKFKKLEKLKLEANKLKFLPGDLFEFTPKISILNFADNQIEAIGESLLDKLENLKEADFKGNKRIDFKFGEESNDLEKLKKIIKNDCKPMRSLMDLSVEALIRTIEVQNIEEVKFIGKWFRVEKLVEKIGC
jgi:hypothetical protein